MAFTNVFNNNLVDLFKVNDKFPVSRITNKLEEFMEKLKPYAEGNATEITENEVINHNLFFPPGCEVDKEIMLAMDDIFKEENEAANLLISILNDRPVDPDDPVKRRDILHRAAVAALVSEKVEAALYESHLVQHHGGVFCADSLRLLEQFFRVCQYPNPGEIQILARACDNLPQNIVGWFHEKRTKVEPLYIARTAIRKEGGVAKYFDWMYHAQLRWGRAILGFPAEPFTSTRRPIPPTTGKPIDPIDFFRDKKS